MGSLRYSINITLDGCCDHRAIPADEELHAHFAAGLASADALLYGRVTYQMMEEAFRLPTEDAGPAEHAPDPDDPFVRSINDAAKFVASSTLTAVDWNAELITGDPGAGVAELKERSPRGVALGGVQLAQSLTKLGLVDEYEFVVHPRLAGHGPTLFPDLAAYVDLTLLDVHRLDSGAVAMRYEPR